MVIPAGEQQNWVGYQDFVCVLFPRWGTQDKLIPWIQPQFKQKTWGQKHCGTEPTSALQHNAGEKTLETLRATLDHCQFQPHLQLMRCKTLLRASGTLADSAVIKTSLRML